MLPEYFDFLTEHSRGIVTSVFALAMLFIDRTVAVVATVRATTVAYFKPERVIQEND